MKQCRITRSGQQQPGKGLRQKEHRAGVDGKAAVIAGLGHVQQVAARQHADTSVVDQRGQRANRCLDPGQMGGMGGGVGHIKDCCRDRPADRCDLRHGSRQFGIIRRAIQSHSKAFARQSQRRGQPDPPAGPSNQYGLRHVWVSL